MVLIRTLVVDDSAFVRKVVREILSASPDIEVVGMARNGEDALEQVKELNPDVVTCDLVMPELDGIGFVRQQMARKALPILILTSSAQDASAALEALDAGAVDIMQKPTALANDKLRGMRRELIEKVRAAGSAALGVVLPTFDPPRTATLARDSALTAMEAPSAPMATSAAGPRSGPLVRAEIVVLGISTGGPQALRYLVPKFPPHFPVPMVIVLHMPVGYTALYAEKLAEVSQVVVREADDHALVCAGEVLIAPAGRHLRFRRVGPEEVRVELSVHPIDTPHRPSVDVLFQSAAEVYGSKVLGVVMTGMGDDGLRGAGWIRAQGGSILTEAEETCVVYGMPRTVVEAGLSDRAVPLQNMMEEIQKRL